MKKIQKIGIVCFLFTTFSSAQEILPTAEEIMNTAYQSAKKENKKVFLMFTASWCTWCHRMAQNMKDKLCTEFFNTNYDHQKSHLEKTQELSSEKLGITLRAFGAPGNNHDSITLDVMNENDEVKVWFYGTAASNKIVLTSSLHDPRLKSWQKITKRIVFILTRISLGVHRGGLSVYCQSTTALYKK